MNTQYNIQEQHPTTDETQIETQTTSTLVAQAADLEPISWSKKQKKNSKTSNIALVSRSSHNLYLQLLL